MRRRIDLLSVPFLCVGLALFSSSCSKSTKISPSAPSTAAVAVTVTEVELGRSVGGNKRVIEKVEIFLPNDTIHASVLTTGSAPSATLKARWTYEDGQLVNESEQAIAATGNDATEFHIFKPDGWPAGKYKLEVFLNGMPVQTREFEVKGT